MPGTAAEYAALAGSWTLIPPGEWEDGSPVTDGDWRDVWAVRCHHARIRRDKAKDKRPQRTAMQLLRSLLSPNQRAELTRGGNVVVRGSEGGTYRILPRFGHVERVTRNGRRWFVAERYCLHDVQDDDAMPPADLSIAHMLILLSDEPEFLRLANANDARDQLWNGEYLRRLRRRHAV